MAMWYKWNVATMRGLSADTESASKLLADTLEMVEKLVDDIDGDTTWAGEHKEVFLAWMELMRIYHGRLNDEAIGSRMASRIGDFANSAEYFERNSRGMAELWSI